MENRRYRDPREKAQDIERGSELRRETEAHAKSHAEGVHHGEYLLRGIKLLNVLVMKIVRARPVPEYLAIKLYDGGPVIYRQKRLTKDGRKFEIWKFRSMIVNAESDGVARLASEHDDRITPVGRIIRACWIDEIPQLFKILKGDMGIVRPRPEIAAQYEEEIPAFALRLHVKAGLTSLAQIYGRYNATPYDKLQMDLMYINRMAVFEDNRLMFATVKVLFQKESMSGVKGTSATALRPLAKESIWGEALGGVVFGALSSALPLKTATEGRWN